MANNQWPLPDRPLPIDKAVKALVDPIRGRTRLRSETDLKKEAGITDPYDAARFWTSLAAVRADMAEAAENWIRERDKRLQKVLGEANGLEPLLKNFIESINLGDLAPRLTRGAARTDDDSANAVAARVDAARTAIEGARAAVRQIAEIAAQTRKDPGAKKVSETPWPTAFAEQMIYGWVCLTGESPRSTTDQLINFVRQANDTLFDAKWPFHKKFEHFQRKGTGAPRGPKGTSWKAQVDKAIARFRDRPEWDRADRYDKEHEPPAKQVIDLTKDERIWTRDAPPAYHKARLDQDDLNWEAEVLDALTLARSATDFAPLAKGHLDQIYARASEPKRKRMAEMGYTPPESAAGD